MTNPVDREPAVELENPVEPCCLAIDVGNTNIVLGVFDGERLAESWRLATLRERTADEVGILVTQLFEQQRAFRSIASTASSCRRSCRR